MAMAEEELPPVLVHPGVIMQYEESFRDVGDRITGRMDLLAATAWQHTPQLHRAATKTIADIQHTRLLYGIAWCQNRDMRDEIRGMRDEIDELEEQRHQLVLQAWESTKQKNAAVWRATREEEHKKILQGKLETVTAAIREPVDRLQTIAQGIACVLHQSCSWTYLRVMLLMLITCKCCRCPSHVTVARSALLPSSRLLPQSLASARRRPRSPSPSLLHSCLQSHANPRRPSLRSCSPLPKPQYPPCIPVGEPCQPKKCREAYLREIQDHHKPVRDIQELPTSPEASLFTTHLSSREGGDRMRYVDQYMSPLHGSVRL